MDRLWRTILSILLWVSVDAGADILQPVSQLGSLRPRHYEPCPWLDQRSARIHHLPRHWVLGPSAVVLGLDSGVIPHLHERVWMHRLRHVEYYDCGLLASQETEA